MPPSTIHFTVCFGGLLSLLGAVENTVGLCIILENEYNVDNVILGEETTLPSTSC